MSMFTGGTQRWSTTILKSSSPGRTTTEALIATALVVLWWHIRRLERVLLIIFLILLPITVAMLYGGKVVRTMQLDVRLPLAGATVRMTARHDMTTALLLAMVTEKIGIYNPQRG